MEFGPGGEFPMPNRQVVDLGTSETARRDAI